MTLPEAQSLFTYHHLPQHLQEVSKPFYDLAVGLFDAIPEGAPNGAMRTKALNELWHAKNWAVGAVAQA